MLRLPDSEPTPSSSSVVQATLVSDVTATDQAQYAQEARARTAQRQAEEAAQNQATISEVLARPIGDKSTPTDEELEAELEELIAEQDRNDSQSGPSP